jgi:hypothetical protein
MAEHHLDYERSDVAPSLVVKLGAGVAAFVVAIPLVMPAIYPQTKQSRSPQPPRIRDGAPVLAVNPRQDFLRFEETDVAALQHYRWIDRDHAVVQIPIKRAMELLVQRGLPGWPAESEGKGHLQ